MKKFIDNLFSEKNIYKFTEFVIRYRFAILIISLIISSISVWLDLQINVNSSIMALLPKDTPSIKRVKELEKKIGGQGDLIVMIESSNKAANIAFAETLLPAIRKLPWVDKAGYKLEDSLFYNKKLLFLDTTDLKSVRDRISNYIDYKTNSVNPFLVNILDDKPAPNLDFSDIESKYSKANNTKRLNVNDDGTMLLLVIHPHGMTSNISFAKKVIKDLKNVVNVFKKSADNQHIKVSVGGTYQNRLDEYDTIIHDLKSGTALGVLAILILIILYFRRISLMICVLVPLIMSETWTFAITRLIIGELNLITAFLIIILFGLGIDFGIHILNRYMIERRDGKNHFDSLVMALHKSARASMTSALTIVASFYMLMFSNFLGFRHFGFIAGTGILLAFVAYMVICPVILTIFNDITKGLWICGKKKESSEKLITSKSSMGRQTAIVISVVLCILTALTIWQMTRVNFEYDFRQLRSQVKSTREFNKKVNSVFKTARDPAAILIKDENDAKAIESYLHDHDLINEKSSVQDVKSICSIVPSDQKRKLEIIKQISDLIEKIKPYVDADQLRKINQMSQLLVTSPLSINEVPKDISSLFFGLPGTDGQVMYLYQRYSLLDLHNAEDFAKAVGTINANGKTFHSISEPLVYLDLVNLLKRDSVIAVIGAMLIILIVLFLDFGSIRSMAIVVMPLVVGLIWMFGIMGVYSIKLNIFNMVILPSILGLGVDAGVQIYHHIQSEWGLPFHKLIIRIGGPNLLCTAINLIGFGGIITAYHPGLRSIGQVAIIGMSTCLISALAVLPVVMALLPKKSIRD